MYEKLKKATGARESSAGDDFHLLWAGRKALELLLPDATLKALGIEGPSKEEAEYLDPEGDKFLAVDLAEYLGDEDFDTADHVVLSQLKYSTRSPKKEWTAARLCEGRHGTAEGSVIHRLAQTFERYYAVSGREGVLSKLQLKLVSNRPAGEGFQNALRAAQQVFSINSSETSTESLLHALRENDRTEIDRLYRASKLDSDAFTVFLRILDISDCGEQSRFGQGIELVKELGCYRVGEVQTQYRQLKGLIWDRMMPEAWTNPLLTKHDILPVFRFSTYRSAYPAEPKFAPPWKVVKRKEASELARTILLSVGKPICLHSGAGKGKTILLHTIERELPQHSVVIVFDCFGGGTYRNPADIRHTHGRAILQICNELAARTGGPLLLDFDLRPEDLLREFIGRVNTAVSLIRKLSADALLAIVVDAADNSVYAAMEKNQESFVHDLLKQPFPEGARLIVSCRTENMGILNLPDHESFKLGGFEPSETAVHLRFYFPDASERQVAEFDRLTKGIPRTQGYALNYRQKGLDAVLSPLRPSGKSLEELIDGRIQEAGVRSGAPGNIDRICEALIALPRPVPLAYIADIADVPSGAVESFCVDVGFGLMVENDGTVSFSDQDFEDYLRQRIPNIDELACRITDLLYGKHLLDHYSAYHIDTFLVKTGRFEDLCKLIFEEDLGDLVMDPVERQEIKLRRIRSAVKVGTTRNKRADIVKLLFIAAETVKTDAAVRRLVMENADLSERFGDPQTVQRLHLEVGRQEWPVPSLFLCAAVLSRFESTKMKARENLKEAEGWLRWRSNIPKDDWQGYRIASEDIAAGAEAILRLHGAKSAQEWLCGWTPRQVIYDSTYRVATSVLRVDGASQLEHHLSNLTVRADIVLAILRACLEANVAPPVKLVETAVKVWHRFTRSRRQPAPEVFADGITLCEIAAREESLVPFVSDLLALFSPSPMSYAPYLYAGTEGQVTTLLRAKILQSKLAGKEVTLDLFLPEELRGKRESLSPSKREGLDRNQKEFKRIFGSLLPAYELRADALLRTISKEVAGERLKHCLDEIGRDYEISLHHDADTIYRCIGLAIADAALLISDKPAAWFHDIEEVILQKKHAGRNPLRVSLAEKAISHQGLHGEALHLLDQVREDLEMLPGTASEKIDLMIRCARVADRIEPDIARHYFQLAVEAASEVDEEALVQMSCLSSFAERAASDGHYSDPELAYHFARYAEDCHHRLYSEEYFPWDAIIKGLSCIDPASGFAVLSRWDDRSVRDIQQGIFPLLLKTVEKGFIFPEAAYALGILAASSDNGYAHFATDILSQALKLGAREKATGLLSMISQDIRLHAPIGERRERASTVVAWAQKEGLANTPGAVSLAELLRFLERKEKKMESDASEWIRKDDQNSPDWENVLSSQSFRTPGEIASVIDAVKGYDTYGHATVIELLKRVQDRCLPRDYVAQLEALIEIDVKRLPGNILMDALTSRFEKWSSHPGVQQWRKEKKLQLLTRCSDEFFFHDRFMASRFKEFRELIDVRDGDILDLVISVLPDWIGAPAPATYEVAKELVRSLTNVEAEAVLRWMIERVSVRIKPKYAEGPWRGDLCPPREAKETLSLFLWNLFGHPDKRLRWRAAHAVRRMVRLGQNEVVDTLVSHASEKSCPMFLDSKHHFLWLSARLSLFILLDRLSKEAPEVVKVHSKWILEEALKPEVPHALIRHFAKSTALALRERYARLYSQDDITKLKAVNKSPFAQVKQKERSPLRNRPTERKKRRFDFNGMDTLPYWYQPLGGRFGVGVEAVADIAEHWICDEWGFGRDHVSNDWLRRKYDWRLWTNHQGAEGIVETLETYLEWHAMFCAADELLRNRPVILDTWEKDPFGDWLGGWTLAWPSQWLSDMRDPVPLEKIYWDLGRSESEDWERQISPDAFDLLVGIREPPRPGFLVLNAWYRRADHSISETMNIESALVTPETAPALLRALQTTSNPRDYRVPPEGDELEIAEEGFELKGWLRSMSSRWGGIDEKDPLRNDLSHSVVIPGRDFTEWSDLDSSVDLKLHWRRGHDRDPVTIFECWDDLRTTEREYIGFYSEGRRLFVRIDALLKYLKDRQRCLIVECMIERWVDKKGMGEYVPGKAKIYLIYPDGTVETLQKRYQLRQATC